jgi:type II secretory ATPase GspE/PulE/Tfp pilus assembly ATPase PilB-like protein
VIFGLFGGGGKKKEKPKEEEEVDPVRFLGALNGKEANLGANQRLADAGLVPAKDLVTDGLDRRAEVIRVEPKGPAAIVNFVVDGVAYPGPRLQKIEASAVTQILKLLAGLDIKERKAAQTGGIKAEFEEKPYTLFINTTAVPDGERLTIKVINPAIKLEVPTDLGMSGDLKAKVREIAGTKPGLFVACGPAGSGTTTTRFATVRGLDAYTVGIFSFCDLGGKNLVNVTEFKPNEGDDLAATLQRIARQEGDVVLVDPLKNEEIAKQVATRIGELMIISELTAKDASHGLHQLVQWLGAEAVAEHVKGVISQKLIRLLCPDCKQAYKPNPEFLKKAGLPASVSMLYRKPQVTDVPGEQEVCEKCEGVGFRSRTGMFEFIQMTDGLREVIKNGGDPMAIRAQMRADKMLTLQQDALRLVADGKTSLDEVQRLFKAPDGK